ncbi:DUF6502 family protein [Marinobacter sp.]|uniref:DUF6502 family protein n=1 Tax=Marinobacter sp. TaxID=50741 RepID=UPI0038517B09
MKNSSSPRLHQALSQILRPLARLLLRNGIGYGEFSELIKQAFVDSALEDFSDPRGKATDSRAAVLTGLTRKEVKRLRDRSASQNDAPVPPSGTSRAARVVSGWLQDREFQDSEGAPAMLAFDGHNSFSELVRRYSGDMTPRAVLDELVRVGVVEPGDRLVLRKRAYIPLGDDNAMLDIFGEDVSDLVSTIDHNLVKGPGQEPLYQRTLSYDNIPPEVMGQWRRYAARHSQQLLETLDEWLAPYDRDVTGRSAQSKKGERVRTGVSVFYFEDPIQGPLEAGERGLQGGPAGPDSDPA